MGMTGRIAAVMIGGLLLSQTAALADEAKSQADKSAAVPKPSTCLTGTGSRIPVKGDRCSEIGHSYTSDDMNRTGATTVAGALRLLDPAITIHR